MVTECAAKACQVQSQRQELGGELVGNTGKNDDETCKRLGIRASR